MTQAVYRSACSVAGGVARQIALIKVNAAGAEGGNKQKVAKAVVQGETLVHGLLSRGWARVDSN